MANEIKIKIFDDEYTLREASEKFGVKIDTLRYRWKRGFRNEKLIQKDSMSQKYIDYKNEHLTISEFAEKYNLDPDMVSSRLDAGYTASEMFLPKYETRHSRVKTVNIFGEKLTIKEICEKYDIPDKVVRSRLEKKYSVEKLISDVKQGVLIRYKDDMYTFDQLSKISGIDAGTLRTRYRNGCRNTSLTRPLRGTGNKKVIEFKGKHYTYGALAKEFGLTSELISQRYRKGWRDDKLVSPMQKNKSSNFKSGRTSKALKVDFYGEKITVKEAHIRTGLSEYTLRKRYKKGFRGDKLFKKSMDFESAIKSIESEVSEALYEKYSTYELRKSGISGHTIEKRDSNALDIDNLSWKTIKTLINMDK